MAALGRVQESAIVTKSELFSHADVGGFAFSTAVIRLQRVVRAGVYHSRLIYVYFRANVRLLE